MSGLHSHSSPHAGSPLTPHSFADGHDWCLCEGDMNRFPTAMSWVIVAQQLAAGSSFKPCHCDGGAGPTQLFLKGAGPGPSYLQTLKISVKNNRNILKCWLEEEEKEKGGKSPLPTAAAVESGAAGTPWAGQAGGQLPCACRARGAGSLSFGSHVVFPPCVKQQLAKLLSSEA